MSFRMLFTAEGISTSIDVQNNTPANELAAGRGCCEAVTHLANVRAIGAGDTWDVDVVYNSADLSGAVLSQKTGITATGLYKMDLVSGVQHGHASAFPNRYRATRQVAGGAPNLSVDYYAVMGANKGGIATVLEIPQTSSISFDVVDTTVGPYLDGGAFSSIAPWVKSTSLTGTWDYQIWGDLAKTDKIAEFLNRTTAGFHFVPLTAPYNSTRVAIPRPRVYSFINTVAGSLTISRIYFAHI